MARIPPHIQESLNAPVGAPLSVGAMSATARSLMGVASGVEKITSAAQGFIEDQQRIENEGDLSAARLKMRETSANSQNKILNNKNLKPGEWEKIYATDMGSYQSAISEGNFSPAVKRQLENDYNQFYGQSKIRLTEGAIRENINRTVSAAQGEINFLEGEQNYDAANGKWQELSDLNMLPQERVDLEIRKNNLKKEDKAFEAKVDFAMGSDDLDAVKHSVKSDDSISPDDKKRKLDYIDKHERVEEYEQVNHVQDQIADASLEGSSLSKDRWDIMEEEGRMSFMSSATKAKLFSSISKSNGATEKDLKSIDSQLAALENGKDTLSDKVYNHKYRQLQETLTGVRKGSTQESQREWAETLHPSLRNQSSNLIATTVRGEETAMERYALAKVSKMKLEGKFNLGVPYYADPRDKALYGMKKYKDQDKARGDTRYEGVTFDMMAKDREAKNIISDEVEYQLTKKIKNYIGTHRGNVDDTAIQKIIDDFTAEMRTKTSAFK